MPTNLAAPVLYVTSSVTSRLVEAWIGSLSEYRCGEPFCDSSLPMADWQPSRFPYPYATTLIHLLLGLAALGLLRMAGSLWADAGRRKELAQSPSSQKELVRGSSEAAAHPRVDYASRTPHRCKDLCAEALAGVCWTAVLLIEVHAQERVDPAFWSIVHLGPMILTVALTWILADSGWSTKIATTLYASLLVLGCSFDAVKQASVRDRLLGVAWSTTSLLWLGAVQVQAPRSMERRPWRRSIFR